jgi:hypothetical protein
MPLVEALRRVCALQPLYSPNNTDEMQERGRLIRHTLPDEFNSMSAELVAALGSAFTPPATPLCAGRRLGARATQDGQDYR